MNHHNEFLNEVHRCLKDGDPHNQQNLAFNDVVLPEEVDESDCIVGQSDR